MVEDPARWAMSPTDHRVHSLLPDDHPPGMLQAWCGHWLPVWVVQHDRLPGWPWCVPCLVAYLVPAPVFPPKIPAGRRSSMTPDVAPGGQSAPDTPAPNTGGPASETGTVPVVIP
jgi:hypothetical protein